MYKFRSRVHVVSLFPFGNARVLSHDTRTLPTQSKTLLDLTKSKYTPYLPATAARQSTLSFGQTQTGDGGGQDSSDEEEEEKGQE